MGGTFCIHPTGTCTATFTSPKLTGGSSDYYVLHVASPVRGGPPYTAECQDIIEALKLSFNEGNILKALWRRAAARLGNGKPGTTSRYDAEKMVFFSERELAQEAPIG
jgi:hypothetical protein